MIVAFGLTILTGVFATRTDTSERLEARVTSCARDSIGYVTADGTVVNTTSRTRRNITVVAQVARTDGTIVDERSQTLESTLKPTESALFHVTLRGDPSGAALRCFVGAAGTE
jgi:hypothetical protein